MSKQNEIEAAAVIVNTVQPQTMDDRKVAMSLKVSENLLRRQLEQDIDAKRKECGEANKAAMDAKKAANNYAREYGYAELMKSGLIKDLLDQINVLLNLAGTETFTVETFLREVNVGVYRSNYYHDADVDADDLLDDDGLLIVRPEVALAVYQPRTDDRDSDCEQVLSYHVSINSELQTLIDQMVETNAKWTALAKEKEDLEKKLKNIKKTVSDVETDLLVKQLREMDGGKETFQGVAAILNGYLNDEERPNLLEAPKDESGG